MGRVISEFLRPNILGAIVITIACAIFAAVVVGRVSFSMTWPCLLLLVYVVYPEADLKDLESSKGKLLVEHFDVRFLKAIGLEDLIVPE